MKIGLRTRLRPDAVERYEQLHREVPDDLVQAIRRAGFSEWHIFRDGVDLFHCIDVVDYDVAIAALADLPVNVAWQATVSELTAVGHDYSGASVDRLKMVWDLSW